MKNETCPRCHGKDPNCEYEKRRARFIAKATSHFDTPNIRREAAELFDRRNAEERRLAILEIVEGVYRWGIRNTDIRLQKPINGEITIADALVKLEALIK